MPPTDSLSHWQAPTFSELRMDAEIGSYQDDFDPVRDAPELAKTREETSR